jgi:LysR family pca operon transcriptional activator
LKGIGVKRRLEQRLKFRHLRVVEAIVAHGSILQAAKALGLSQPAVTKTLHDVEEIVGARLFDRHARGVAPNAYGAAVGQAARRLLAEASRLEDELTVLDGGDGGAVVVGALPVTAAGLLPGALARFQAAHPDIEVRVHQDRSEALLAALSVRNVDLVVGRLYEPDEPDGFERTALYDEAIAFVARAGHPLFAGPAPGLADIAGYRTVLPTVSQRVGREIDAFLERLGFSPAFPLRSSSAPLIRETLLATDAVAVMPKAMLAGDLLRGQVRALAVDGPRTARPAGLIQRGGAPLTRNVAAFVRTYRAYVAEAAGTLD